VRHLRGVIALEAHLEDHTVLCEGLLYGSGAGIADAVVAEVHGEEHRVRPQHVRQAPGVPVVEAGVAERDVLQPRVLPDGLAPGRQDVVGAGAGAEEVPADGEGAHLAQAVPQRAGDRQRGLVPVPQRGQVDEAGAALVAQVLGQAQRGEAV